MVFRLLTSLKKSLRHTVCKYRMSGVDERAMEMINSGRFPSANQLVGVVTVNKKTGKVTMDSSSEIWWLW